MANKIGKRAASSTLPLPLFDEDYASGVTLFCGADEAGRGANCGACFCGRGHSRSGSSDCWPERFQETVRTSTGRAGARNQTVRQAWAIAECSIEEIDELNILHASMLAMKRAIESLAIRPELALIDGNRCPKLAIAAKAIVKGDDKVPAISAASILAKTARDAVMLDLHRQYPEYGFDRHKGYPTAYHLEQLSIHGVSPVHRKTYAPVRKILEPEAFSD